MDVFEALYTTRAMRRVKEDPVPDNIIQSMIDSAIRAPSGSNRQNWKFLVVTDKNIREKLSNIYRETWDYYINSFLWIGQFSKISLWHLCNLTSFLPP